MKVLWMNWDSHFEPKKLSTATEATEYLAAVEIAPCLAAATAAVEAIETT